MSALHVYLKPFANDQGTDYVADWIEVTDDVRALGGLTQALDNTEYDVGVFRASSLKLTLSNHHGRYSDVGQVETIFRYKREPLVKVTWEPGDKPLICGFFYAGRPDAVLTEEVTVFEGLLSDIATQSKIDKADVEFTVLGFESFLSGMAVPYADITNGDSFQSVFYSLLNQAPFNERVTVTLANLAPPAVTIDDKTWLQNKTVLEALKDILVVTNCVLYLKDNTVYVQARTADTDLAYTFYGPSAELGLQNIVDIEKYRTGANRVLNFFTWRSTTLAVGDATSRAKYGDRKRELGSDLITDNTKRTARLTSLKDEFSLPKREMELETPMNTETLALTLLNKVSVDYPRVTIPSALYPVAQYDISNYDEAFYAGDLLPLEVETSARFKVMTRACDFKNQTLKFSLREI